MINSRVDFRKSLVRSGVLGGSPPVRMNMIEKLQDRKTMYAVVVVASLLVLGDVSRLLGI